MSEGESKQQGCLSVITILNAIVGTLVAIVMMVVAVEQMEIGRLQLVLSNHLMEIQEYDKEEKKEQERLENTPRLQFVPRSQFSLKTVRLK